MVILYDFLVGGKADGTPTADNGVAERELSIPYVANAKKVAQWDLGRTLYDNNDRDLIRRR